MAKIQFAKPTYFCQWNQNTESMTSYSIIRNSTALGRKGTENGVLFFCNGAGSFLLLGERIHGETLTINVPSSTGKDAYPTYSAEEKALRMKSKNGRRTKRIYKCRECGYYHFTTNDGSMRQARPYHREKEKGGTRRQTYACPYCPDLVTADGFSMKRFRNYLSRMRAAI